MSPQLDQLTSLPSLPTVAIQILKAFSDPDTAVLDVVTLMQTDPALSAKVLKAANSARFSAGRSVCSMQRAVLLLGKKLICSLALGFSLAEASMTRGRHVKHFQIFWLQSFARALAAQAVAQRFGGCPPEDAFTVGLLSMIGRLVLLKHDPNAYAACIDEAEQQGVSLESVERERLSITSIELTASMMEKWNLPERFVKAVRSQSEPMLNAEPTRKQCDLNQTLRIAGEMGVFVATAQRALPLVRLHELVSELTAATNEVVDGLITTVRNQLGEHAELFHIEVSSLGSPTDLLGEALQQLTELNLALSDKDQNISVPQELAWENSRLRRRISELTRDSTIDPLTNVFNRRYFSMKLQETIASARVRCVPVAILLGDIDRFKQVNDTHGHMVGDEVLRQVAECLRNAVRGSDVVARYGGEEFVILVDTTEAHVLNILGERIRSIVERATADPTKCSVPATISLGGALGYPGNDDPNFGEHLISLADRALYTAKTTGRNRVVIAENSGAPIAAETTASAASRPAPASPPRADRLQTAGSAR